MKLIVGLGNPGEKYKNNRHNAGFMVIDSLAQKLGIEDWKLNSKFHSLVATKGSLMLAKPQTFMNNSGDAVLAILKFYKIKPETSFIPPAISYFGFPNLFVIHDDLDIPLGQYKIQNGTGPKGHNGLISIQEALKTGVFYRIRIGVEHRELNSEEVKISGEEYVLQDFDPEEKKTLDGVIDKIIKDLGSRLY